MSDGDTRSFDGRIERDVRDMRKEIVELTKSQARIQQRLENGTKVFTDWDERIGKVEHRTAPKPTPVWKVAMTTIGLFCTAAGALWGLSNMLRDRPTTDQIQRVFESREAIHNEAGHKRLRLDVGAIQKEQAVQHELIRQVQADQRGQGDKLDQLLERVPARGRRPR